jgi:hypothetical protein
MKTKSLLIAAATLAAGIISSQAAVYSQNIVGYVNAPVPAANAYSIIQNPLSDGNGNLLANVLTNCPNGTTILLFVGGSYNSYSYDSSRAIGSRWYGATEDDFLDNSLSIPPGVAFWIQQPGGATNITFVGSVVTGTNNLPVTVGYGLYGYTAPVSTNANAMGLNAVLPVGANILKWSGGFAQYTLQSDKVSWYSLNDDDFITPTFNVGEGFFIQTLSAVTWTNVFTVQ